MKIHWARGIPGFFVLSLFVGCNGEPDPPAEPFIPAEISIKEAGEFKELLNDSLIFIDSNGVKWTAPQGTLTDGASVPRLALPITDGRWDNKFLKAAIVHDAYCQEENETRTPVQYRTKPWRSVHKMFYEACLAGGTSPMLAKMMFAAVWLAGPRWDEQNQDLGDVSSEVLTRGFSAVKSWIEENNPTIDQIASDIDRREPILVSVQRFETSINIALASGKIATAKELLNEERQFINGELRKTPDDPMLLVSEGHLHKNKALTFQKAGSTDEAKAELDRSEQVFKSVIETSPNNFGAIKGMSSVSIMRGDLDGGEQYIKRALILSPDYQPAVQELRRIEQLRASDFERVRPILEDEDAEARLRNTE